jgi:amidophosphoribosyltransferase
MKASAKIQPAAKLFQDKSVVLIDDSIVRGTTIRKIVRLIKTAVPAKFISGSAVPKSLTVVFMGSILPPAMN